MNRKLRAVFCALAVGVAGVGAGVGWTQYQKHADERDTRNAIIDACGHLAGGRSFKVENKDTGETERVTYCTGPLGLRRPTP